MDQAFRERALKEPIAALRGVDSPDLPPDTPVNFRREIQRDGDRSSSIRSDQNEITDLEMLSGAAGEVTSVVWVAVLANPRVWTAIVGTKMGIDRPNS